MNNAKYASLPADLKKIIDDHSGMAGAKLAGNAWDTSGVPVREMVEKRGNAIHVLSADETARWKATCKPVVDTWLSDMKAKNIDGEKLLADATALVAKYEKT